LWGIVRIKLNLGTEYSHEMKELAPLGASSVVKKTYLYGRARICYRPLQGPVRDINILKVRKLVMYRVFDMFVDDFSA
jgi:hypothetical protein